MLINKITSVVLTLETYKASLVPRPLSDFISQPWRKIGRRPGIKIRHEPEMVDSVSTNRKTEKTGGLGGRPDTQVQEIESNLLRINS